LKPLDADRSVYHGLLKLLAKLIDTLGRWFEPGDWPDLIVKDGSGKSANPS
jgi:hypothetical protein